MGTKKYTSFEDLEVWKKARELVKFVYSFSKGIPNRSFQDQLQRAAISVMNNIAEGHEGGSPKTLVRYLKIAKGSCGEVRSMLYAGSDLRYLSFGKQREGLERAAELSRMLAGFIKNVAK